jgi:hypothetical protein
MEQRHMVFIMASRADDPNCTITGFFPQTDREERDLAGILRGFSSSRGPAVFMRVSIGSEGTGKGSDGGF